MPVLGYFAVHIFALIIGLERVFGTLSACNRITTVIYYCINSHFVVIILVV